MGPTVDPNENPFTKCERIGPEVEAALLAKVNPDLRMIFSQAKVDNALIANLTKFEFTSITMLQMLGSSDVRRVMCPDCPLFEVT